MAEQETAGPILQHSPGFPAWLAAQACSVALTTYQAGRLFLIGLRPDGSLRAHERLIEQCQGLWTDGQTLWTAGLHTLWRFANDVPDGLQTDTGADRLFVPREGRVTGQIDIHDIAMADLSAQGGPAGLQPVFISTAFNCIATISDRASFRALWRPPFISALVGEDRCHLNGLAMQGARMAYASAVAISDQAGGWRDHRRDGGVIIDVASGEVMCRGLSMPHSPRLYRGRLWVLNSGRGELATVDIESGGLTPVAFCPGYARGLGFVGNYAVIGLSQPRHNKTFSGLDLEDRLQAAGRAAICGLIIVDLTSGHCVEWLRFEHTVSELYDVAVLPGVRQAEAVGFIGDGIRQRVTPGA